MVTKRISDKSQYVHPSLKLHHARTNFCNRLLCNKYLQLLILCLRTTEAPRKFGDFRTENHILAVKSCVKRWIGITRCVVRNPGSCDSTVNRLLLLHMFSEVNNPSYYLQ
ncbi:hypothetical protein CEXT_740871 [Caerostris extrusa]|uniref:Uncharacterized protein n=1 Tax=Caerostris extrusa TaxID=172846 RepID=A0AAV4XB45_CAEEX|nr:hypothetical protein CEXT_740871 [Caerostris extrusa]